MQMREKQSESSILRSITANKSLLHSESHLAACFPAAHQQAYGTGSGCWRLARVPVLASLVFGLTCILLLHIFQEDINASVALTRRFSSHGVLRVDFRGHVGSASMWLLPMLLQLTCRWRNHGVNFMDFFPLKARWYLRRKTPSHHMSHAYGDSSMHEHEQKRGKEASHGKVAPILALWQAQCLGCISPYFLFATELYSCSFGHYAGSLHTMCACYRCF